MMICQTTGIPFTVGDNLKRIKVVPAVAFFEGEKKAELAR